MEEKEYIQHLEKRIDFLENKIIELEHKNNREKQSEDSDRTLENRVVELEHNAVSPDFCVNSISRMNKVESEIQMNTCFLTIFFFILIACIFIAYRFYCDEFSVYINDLKYLHSIIDVLKSFDL
ncbi:MAG: hypothetical protein NC180_11765 [Muribaculaceae bacterium]|nr:hypothetical protein [Roseburia sp.]MCM1430932.1 hypothetical protein [Muribaculaceae bacterium]MCM1493880.1 hypothetical protein [Muribaculaceae bacterium]